jgi:hypothetical protein
MPTIAGFGAGIALGKPRQQLPGDHFADLAHGGERKFA